MMHQNSNDTPNIDSIANEMLKHDILAFSEFCESLCTGTSNDGGVGQAALISCFTPVVSFGHECAIYECAPNDVEIEQFTSMISATETSVDEEETWDGILNKDMEKVTSMKSAVERSVDQGEEGMWDCMLSKVEENCNVESAEQGPKPRDSAKLREHEKRSKRLDADTLDALTQLLNQIPNENVSNDYAKVKQALRRVSSDDTTAARIVSVPSVEDISTTPLVGKRRIPSGIAFPVQVYGFQKVAQEMAKSHSFHLKQSRKAADVPRVRGPSEKQGVLGDSSTDFSSRQKSSRPKLYPEEDWEYLNDTTGTDPIFSPPPNKKPSKIPGAATDPAFAPPPKKRSLTLTARKFLSNRRNLLGRHRFTRFTHKDDKISVHEDGSVQVNLAD
jgi:hypothetical protein